MRSADGGVKHKSQVMDVFLAALQAVDPYMAVTHSLDALLPGIDAAHVYVVGAGKAGAAMSRATEDTLGDRITAGIVVVKDGHSGPRRDNEPEPRVRLVEAGHPVPDIRGVQAANSVREMAARAGEDDLVICLISGGGSALLASPAEGIDLEDLQTTTGLLLRAGATINELNAVRKHLSSLSGGQLARSAHPARVVSLILSDVTGCPLDVIASGPTAPDPTTYADALDVLGRYRLKGQIPPAALDRLQRGAAGDFPETPKHSDPVFEHVENAIVASNLIAVEAAAEYARRLGLNTAIMSTYLEGEAKEAGIVLAGLAKEVAGHNRPQPRPACLLFGGETTVTVRGEGVGGRNTELALGAAIALQGMGQDVVVAAFASDGGDGTSPAAGAIADGTSIDRGKALGLDAARALLDNDSYTYWAALGDAIITGPTGTNVNDLAAVFVF